MIDIITGTVPSSRVTCLPSCSLFMFLLVTCSSRVNRWTTSQGSPIASSSTYISLDMIRRGNQGRAQVRITYRCSSAMDHDQKPRYQRVPSSTALCVHPQGLSVSSRHHRSLIVAPLLNIQPTRNLTWHKLGCIGASTMRRRDSNKGSHKVRSQQAGDPKIKTQRKRAQLNCQGQLSRRLLLNFHIRLVSTQ